MSNTLKLFILLPCVISAQISIELIPNDNPELVVSGNDRVKANDIDLNAFQLTESGVKENLARMYLTWKRIGEVNINHASVFGHRDLYVTLKPTSHRIIRKNDKITKLNKVNVRNRGIESRTTKPILRHEATESITTKWYENQELSVGSDIKHILGTKLTHSSRYGHQDYASRPVTLEAEPADQVELQPGDTVRAELQVTETTLEVRVDYEATLDGDIYFGYLCGQLLTSHCLEHDRLDVNDYLKRSGQSPDLKSYEVVTFTYYQDPRVTFGAVQPNPTPEDTIDIRLGNDQYKFNALQIEQVVE